MPLNFKKYRLAGQMMAWCLLILNSCVKEKLFNPSPGLPPRLFVRAQLDPQLGAEVLITKATTGGDTIYLADLQVNNAKVRMIGESGDTFYLPRVAASRYRLAPDGLSVVAGEKYMISVQVNGFEEVISEWVAIPLPALIGRAEFGPVEGTQGSSFGYGEGTVEFSDMPHSRDFYLLRFMGRSDGHPLQGMDYGVSSVQICDIAQYFQPVADAVVRDDCFEGSEQAQLKLAADLRIAKDDFSGQVRPDEVLLIFGSVSESYYNFIFSLIQPEGFEKGLSEPKPSYSNIRGGLGVFYTSNTQTRTIRL